MVEHWFTITHRTANTFIVANAFRQECCYCPGDNKTKQYYKSNLTRNLTVTIKQQEH